MRRPASERPSRSSSNRVSGMRLRSLERGCEDPWGQGGRCPRWRAGYTELIEVIAVPDRIHRMPETGMLVGEEFAVLGQAAQRCLFERLLVPAQVIEHARLEDEEPAVDPGLVLADLFGEFGDARAFEL